MAEIKRLKLPIYLDYQSTTPTDPRVIKGMLPYFFDKPGNPHSQTHVFGVEAQDAVDEARKQVATAIGADTREIIFTSGATESNNLAIKGAIGFLKKPQSRIVTVSTEHKCVIEACRYLESLGHQVIFLPVNTSGLLDLQKLADHLTDDTSLVSVMTAHNEIGVVQQISKIGALCRENGVLFHTDAAQGVGKIPIDVNRMNIDLMSISGHKIYGPMGIGALYVRRRPRVRVAAQIDGGGQERGLRSGTLPTPLCVGLGLACQIAVNEMQEESERIKSLRDRLRDGIVTAVPDVILHGDFDNRLPGNLNLSFAGLDGQKIMSAIPDIAISSGSACTSNSIEPSYVIRALGFSNEIASGSIRFGLGRYTTKPEIDYTVQKITDTVSALRN